MSSQKLATIFGALGTLESSYDSGGALSAATDGILMREETLLTVDPIVEGGRGRAPAGMGTLTRSNTGGLKGDITIPIEGRGQGSAYATAADEVPDLHNILRAAGHDAAFVTDTWNFTPQGWDGTTPAFDSLVMELYGRGEKYAMQAAYATVGFEVELGGYMNWACQLMGLASNPVDAALPSITYNTTEPAKALAGLSVGLFTTAKWRSIEFTQARTIGARSLYGFAPGYRAPQFTVQVEATPLVGGVGHTAGGLDPWALREQSTGVALALQVGSVAGNTFDFAASNAQCISIAQEEEDGVAMWRLGFALAQSDLVSADDYTLSFS